MTAEETENLRESRIAAKMALQVLGEDAETALAIVLTALQLVGLTCGLSREDVVHLAIATIKVEPPTGAKAEEGRVWS